MTSHPFLIWRRVFLLRVMEYRCLVNFDAWGYFSSELISGHLMRSAKGWSLEEECLFEMIDDSFMSIYLIVLDLNSLSLIFLFFKFCYWYFKLGADFFWRSCYRGVHYMIIWMKRFYCLDLLLLMKWQGL